MRVIGKPFVSAGLGLLACAGCSTAMLAVENPTLAAASAMGDAAANITNAQTDRNAALLGGQYAAATAAAARPGDDQLTCEQLNAEYSTLAESPEQAALNQTTSDFGKAQAGKAAASAAVGGAATVAGGIATAGNPAARDALILGQSASALAQATANQGAADKPVAAISGQMPAMARMQRVIDLADNKECAWAKPPGGAAAGTN